MSLSKEELIAKAKANHQARILEQTKKAQELRDKLEAQKLQQAALRSTIVTSSPVPQVVKSVLTSAAYGFQPTIPGFTYNERQTEAIELAMRAKSLCLIGAAGSGKTTTTREIIGQLVRLPHIWTLTSSTKYLSREEPAIVIVSFTNKAVNNIKKFLPPALQKHCITIHKLLEFEPIRDPESNKIIGFGPKLNSSNPLPRIACIIWEESSMIGTDLAKMLYDALPIGNTPQEIFLGDLNQLPPIFGPSILGFKLLELQTVELTEIYRQALQSPIVSYAHRIREGKSSGLIFEKDKQTKKLLPIVVDSGEHGKVTFKPWSMKLESRPATVTAAAFIVSLIKAGEYNPETDVILCPFNKSFGTLELNKFIAQHLGKQRNAEVFEILARGTYHYFAAGDRILYDRQDAEILSIHATANYIGKPVREASIHMNRWGVLSEDGKSEEQFKLEMQEAEEKETDPNYDPLDSMSDLDDEEEQKNLASHTLKIKLLDSGQELDINTSGELNKLVFSYCITFHKSQGSEWKKVFILLHHTHNKMLSRELMYTGFTRAKHELFVLMDPGFEGKMDSVTWAAKKPEIKGVTLEEKAEYFKSVASKYKG